MYCFGYGALRQRDNNHKYGWEDENSLRELIYTK